MNMFYKLKGKLTGYFDWQQYLKKYPDLKKRWDSPLKLRIHFLLFAKKEGRKMNMYPKKILVFGLAKTGTTALFSKIEQSLPMGYVKFFEPKTKPTVQEQNYMCNQIKNSPNVLVKEIFKIDENYSQYDSFDKRVYIARDPRDRLISFVIFLIGDRSFYTKNREVKCSKILTLLQKKKTHPKDIPFTEMMKKLEEIFFEEKNEEEKKHWKNWLQLKWHNQWIELYSNNPQKYHFFKYEDLIDKNFTELEKYLGFEIKKDAEVNKNLSRVVRTKKYGGWKDWLTPEDVLILKPMYDPLLKKMDYDRTWALNENQKIDSEHCENYILRIWRDWTFREDPSFLIKLEGLKIN